MIESKIVNRSYCMLCGKELTEDEGIFFCKECGYKVRYENNKRKKELEDRLNASVQNLIDQEICKEPSLWWRCERCRKLIPYMANLCHECADELLGDPPKPFEPTESEGYVCDENESERNCQFCKSYKNEFCNVLDMKPCYPELGCDYFSEREELKKDTIQVLNKIRAKIEKYKATIDNAISEDELKIEGMKEAYADCLNAIDEYKAEIEPQESEDKE